MIPQSDVLGGEGVGKPRASGDDPRLVVQISHVHADPRRVVNPARAGMIRVTTSSESIRAGKPRASGDDPAAASMALAAAR